MSRLYGILRSDMAKTEATRRASEEIECEIRWGDKYNSKLAVKVIVKWEYGMVKPEVAVFLGDVVLLGGGE